jgi:ribosomal protein S18 acetylase RimI-like enzyme
MEPTGHPLEVRDARLDDVPALAALLSELGYPTPAATLAERLDALRRAGEVVLVAARDGDPLGVLTIHVTPVLHRPTPVGRLTALVVAERARGQGVGRALVEAGEEILAARGCALVEVTSNRRRTEAHAFYERLGYEATSLRLKKSLPSEGAPG